MSLRGIFSNIEHLRRRQDIGACYPMKGGSIDTPWPLVNEYETETLHMATYLRLIGTTVYVMNVETPMNRSVDDGYLEVIAIRDRQWYNLIVETFPRDAYLIDDRHDRHAQQLAIHKQLHALIHATDDELEAYMLETEL